MRIFVNGDEREVAPETTVLALIAELGLSGGPVAVERNQEVVPRAAHASTVLVAGDHLEIVHFVGGG